MCSSNIYLQILHFYVYIFFANYKEENARKKPKFANHSSQSIKISGFLFIIIFENLYLDFNLTTHIFAVLMKDKRSQSEKLFQNTIQRKPLQELDLSKYSSFNLFLYTLFLHEWLKYGCLLFYIQCCYNNPFSDLQNNNNNLHNINSIFQTTIGKLSLLVFQYY